MAPNNLQIIQNFDKEVEASISKQINLELFASYNYLLMAHHFEAIGLKGFQAMFKAFSAEEHDHAQKFMTYLNDRGGVLSAFDVQKPERLDFDTGLDAVKRSLELEKDVNQKLLELHGLASKKNDAHFADFLESEFLDEQVKSIKTLSDYVKNLERVGPGLGEYQFDRLTLAASYCS